MFVSDLRAIEIAATSTQNLPPQVGTDVRPLSPRRRTLRTCCRDFNRLLSAPGDFA